MGHERLDVVVVRPGDHLVRDREPDRAPAPHGVDVQTDGGEQLTQDPQPREGTGVEQVVRELLRLRPGLEQAAGGLVRVRPAPPEGPGVGDETGVETGGDVGVDDVAAGVEHLQHERGGRRGGRVEIHVRSETRVRSVVVDHQHLGGALRQPFPGPGPVGARTVQGHHEAAVGGHPGQRDHPVGARDGAQRVRDHAGVERMVDGHADRAQRPGQTAGAAQGVGVRADVTEHGHLAVPPQHVRRPRGVHRRGHRSSSSGRSSSGFR